MSTPKASPAPARKEDGTRVHVWVDCNHGGHGPGYLNIEPVS